MKRHQKLYGYVNLLSATKRCKQPLTHIQHHLKNIVVGLFLVPPGGYWTDGRTSGSRVGWARFSGLKGPLPRPPSALRLLSTTFIKAPSFCSHRLIHPSSSSSFSVVLLNDVKSQGNTWASAAPPRRGRPRPRPPPRAPLLR